MSQSKLNQITHSHSCLQIEFLRQSWQTTGASAVIVWLQIIGDCSWKFWLSSGAFSRSNWVLLDRSWTCNNVIRGETVTMSLARFEMSYKTSIARQDATSLCCHFICSALQTFWDRCRLPFVLVWCQRLHVDFVADVLWMKITTMLVDSFSLPDALVFFFARDLGGVRQWLQGCQRSCICSATKKAVVPAVSAFCWSVSEI